MFVKPVWCFRSCSSASQQLIRSAGQQVSRALLALVLSISSVSCSSIGSSGSSTASARALVCLLVSFSSALTSFFVLALLGFLRALLGPFGVEVRAFRVRARGSALMFVEEQRLLVIGNCNW